jgi:chorismate lyase/3-hydroxybenzoate synthase
MNVSNRVVMSLDFVSTAELAGLDPKQVLGGTCVGVVASPVVPPWPMQGVHMPLLEVPGPLWHEVWLSGSPVVFGESEGIRWSRSGDGVLFGALALTEDGLDLPDSGSALRHISELAYARIFRLLDAQGLPHLWRVWNYIPDINGEQAGLERYRQFNLGRGDAFERCERSVTEQVPAACALGVGRGPLSIAFMAGATPVVPIENPRQVSAYRYPDAYGPRSPTFSRATLAHLPGQELFFVSGTASIVGHETLHLGDVVGQAKESLNNVEAVLLAANRVARGQGFSLSDLVYRVYVRDAADAPAVMAVMRERLGAVEMLCVQSDVCRADLLVEVEAHGLRPC